MIIEAIGHAGFVVRSGEDVLVTDPWLSSDGAFDSAWFQFPCNHDLFHPVAQAIREARNPAIYISHEHKDHFDAAFLGAIVERQPTVFIADFRNKHLQRELEALGFQNIIEARNGKELRHGALKLHIFVDDNAINRDSAIRVSDGSAAFLNLNDCKIFDRLALIRREMGPVDVFTCQFSGATWHPTCYEYDEQLYRQISLRKQYSKFRSVLEAIRKVEPRRYLASAGPACFLDAGLIEKNFEPENIFPRQPKLLAFLKPKLPDVALDPVGPGDVLDAESNTFIEHGRERCDEDEFSSYIYRYRDRVQGALGAISRERSEGEYQAIFDALVEELRRKLEPFVAPRPIGSTVVLSVEEVPSRYIHLDLNDQRLSIHNHRPDYNFYHLAAPAWQIDRVLKRQISWEDFSLTFRARLERRPDVYDTLVNGFFFSQAEDIPRMIEVVRRIQSSSARIVVQTAQGPYEIDRYCPHQGADLSYGWFEDGNWICPRHGWRFQVGAGGVSSGTRDSINACLLSRLRKKA